MSQHFLLSAKVRSMSLRQIFALRDDEAFGLFRHSRWGNGEEVTCPERGSIAIGLDDAYCFGGSVE